MTVAANSLMAAQGGDVEKSFFPGESDTAVETRLQAWITEGYSRAAAISDDSDKDEAATHFAYYKAYMSVFRRLSAQPTSFQAADAGGHSYTQEQIRNFKTLADTELALHEALLPALSTQVGTSLLPPHVTTNSRVEW